MFVWMFHRISGLLLIFLLAVQLITGVFQSSTSNSETIKSLAQLHSHPALIVLLALLIVFHALYGLRTILMDLGMGRERLLFWVATSLGLVLFVGFLVFFLTVKSSLKKTSLANELAAEAAQPRSQQNSQIPRNSPCLLITPELQGFPATRSSFQEHERNRRSASACVPIGQTCLFQRASGA